MGGLARLRAAFERLLEGIVVFLMTAMFVIVVLGVTYRKLGAALVWYDEVAEIALAWLTYYGAALAALKRGHIGMPTLVERMPVAGRKVSFVAAEAVVFAFFIMLAWVGWRVVEVLEVDFLVSLPAITTQYTQSVIPIGAMLFIVAEALSLPQAWRSFVVRGPQLAAAASEPGGSLQ